MKDVKDAKIVRISDGAYFVQSYSEQTIARAYSIGTTTQSFGFGNYDDDRKERNVFEKQDDPRPLVG